MLRKKVKPVMSRKTGIRYSEEVRSHAIKLRRETGATRKQIAERIGTCPETVRRWLTNHLVQLSDDEKERHIADAKEIKRLRKEQSSVYSLSLLCRLAKVSRSGYYDWPRIQLRSETPKIIIVQK